jgi:SM-20-related protein
MMEFVNAQEFLTFMRTVTGLPQINRAAIRATRFRVGHFEMFHAATFSADRTGRRAAAFSINLTPEWKPEWGGLLAFRRHDAGSIVAYMPTFNSLDVFGFPVGYWISHVAPFASAVRLAISGRLYIEP